MPRHAAILFASLLGLAAAAHAGAGPMLDGKPWPDDGRGHLLKGVVVVDALVGTDGATLRAEVARSSGHAELDRAALTAVRQWRFQPRMREGKAVQAQVRMPVQLDPSAVAPAAGGKVS